MEEYKLPKGYVWETQWAVRKNKRGKAIGKRMMRVRREIESKKMGNWIKRQGSLARKIRIERKWWRVIGVYVRDKKNWMS